MHLDLDEAVALARLAAAALDVEAEPAGLVAAGLAFGEAREPVADLGEGAGVGGGIGTRGAADGRLVDLDHLVAVIEAGDLVVRARHHARAVEMARGRRIERVDGEGRLARTRHAGDAGEGAERQRCGDVVEVVRPRAMDGELVPVALAPLGRDGNLAPAGEIGGGERFLGLEHLFQRAFGHHLAPVDAGAGAEIDHVIGGADRVLVMLDHDHRVAEIAQALQRFEQPVVVALVEADGGLVQHVEHARQARADLAGEADALALPARQRAAGPVEVEIVEPDIVEEAQPLVDFLQDGMRDLRLRFGKLAG